MQNTWHTYSVDWTKEKLDFIIDGTTVRTVKYTDPLAVYGKNYPQTPMQLKVSGSAKASFSVCLTTLTDPLGQLGNWAGGAQGNSEGTIEWAGGDTDFSKGPFNMYVKKVEITNYNPACSYKYGDKSGSYESIDLINTGDSCKADSSSSTAVDSGSASATASGTGETTATVAPTSSHVVDAVAQTEKAVSSTVTGSAYSTNSASISALNSGFQTGTAVATQVPNQSAGINGTATGSGTVTGPSSSSSITASTGDASLTSIVTLASLLSVFLGFWVL